MRGQRDLRAYVAYSKHGIVMFLFDRRLGIYVYQSVGFAFLVAIHDKLTGNE